MVSVMMRTLVISAALIALAAPASAQQQQPQRKPVTFEQQAAQLLVENGALLRVVGEQRLQIIDLRAALEDAKKLPAPPAAPDAKE